MSSDSTSRTLFLLVVLGVTPWAVWLIHPVLPPFLIALVLALLLDPLLDRMHRRGVPRSVAVALTFLAFLGLFAAVLLFVVPRGVAQIADLVRNMDVYRGRLEDSV